MMFERTADVFKTLHIGERTKLDIVSSVDLSLLIADHGRWEELIKFYGNSKYPNNKDRDPETGRRGAIVMEKLTHGYLSRKWIRQFFNLSVSDAKKITHVSVSCAIKPENRKAGHVGKLYGRMIYEYDEEIYEISELHFLIDDL